MTSSSRTMAIRRVGSPGAAHAACPVSSSHAVWPGPVKSTVTNQPPAACASNPAVASSMPSPVSAAGPSRSGVPVSSGCTDSAGSVPSASGVVSAAAMPRTGWKVSWAVRPITSTASRGSVSPGSSTTMRRSPARTRVGSATPSASTRRRRTSSARSVASVSAVTVGESCASSTIWVPPRRSRPRVGAEVSTAAVAATSTASESRARTNRGRPWGADDFSLRREGEDTQRLQSAGPRGHVPTRRRAG